MAEFPARKNWALIADIGNVDTLNRQIAISLALELHRRQHGRFPERLEDIRHRGGVTLPLNLWTAASFTYQRTADGDATLKGREDTDSFLVSDRAEQRAR